MKNALISFSVLASVFVGSMTVAPAADTFNARANAVISYHSSNSSTSEKRGFWYAEAKFYDYQTNSAGAAKLTDARNEISGIMNGITDQWGLWGATDCYLRYRSFYTPSQDSTTHTQLVNSTLYNYDQSTPNKILMSATCRYLAHETWPTETFGSDFINPDGSSDPTGYNYLLAQCNNYVHQGPLELNSGNYLAIHYACFRSLADLAKDPVLKNKAALTAEWLLVSWAPLWLNGHLASQQERTYHPLMSGNSYEAGDGLLWLFFGGPMPADMSASEMYYSVSSVVTNFRPSSVITNIAQTRTADYVHKQSDHFFKQSWNDNFYRYQTSFVSSQYGVYSCHDYIDPMSNFTKAFSAYFTQMLDWGVCWTSASGDAARSTFLVQHPLNTKVANFGATAYEQVLQNKGTVIGVFDIPATDSNPWLYGWIPNNAAALINNAATTGRIYLNYHNVMIALCLTDVFSWNGTDTTFQKPASKIGLVVEVVNPDNYAGSDDVAKLSAFKTAVDSTFNGIVWIPNPADGAPVLNYASLDGTMLETKYNGANTGYDKINSVTVTYDATYPLLDDHWMHQDYNRDVLTVNDGIHTRTYNFSTWTVAETPNSTAIGRQNRSSPGIASTYGNISMRYCGKVRGITISAPAQAMWTLDLFSFSGKAIGHRSGHGSTTISFVNDRTSVKGPLAMRLRSGNYDILAKAVW